jgi:SAM-dependent methyltransferase
MNIRNTYPRKRNFKKEQSLWNPLFLQLNFLIETASDYFTNLPDDRELIIYDLGCGQKPYQVFVSKKHKYIGVDIDKANLNADIYADITNLPIEDGVADIVTSFCVIEHVKDPQRVLCEKYRILKKGGELFMFVPLYWEEHEQPYDYFRFTRYGIEYLMRNSGFKNIEIKELNSNPSILGMHLVRYFNRRFFKVIIPIINYYFYKKELKVLKNAKKFNMQLSNVMTFIVKGKK